MLAKRVLYLLGVVTVLCVAVSVLLIDPLLLPRKVEHNATFVVEEHIFNAKVMNLLQEIDRLYQEERPVHCAVYNDVQISTYECGYLTTLDIYGNGSKREGWRYYRNNDVDLVTFATLFYSPRANVSTMITVVGGTFSATLYYLAFLGFSFCVGFLLMLRDGVLALVGPLL